MSTSAPHAVFTGDLIGSSKLTSSELENVRAMVSSSLAAVNEWPDTQFTQPDFFRGDSWQAVSSTPHRALRIALLLRARIRHQGIADSRIAIGLGEIEKIDPAKVSLSTGEAFTLSGHALDGLKTRRTLAISLSETDSPSLNLWMPTIATLCDALASGWTKRQAEIVALALHPSSPTYEAIAEELGITPQSVFDSLSSAHWQPLEETIDTFEAEYRQPTNFPCLKHS